MGNAETNAAKRTGNKGNFVAVSEWQSDYLETRAFSREVNLSMIRYVL
jgi:hypothetical protein